MSKFNDELYALMEQAYMEENGSVQLSFDNRVYKKYGKEFNKKYDYISGKNTAMIAEQLKNTGITEYGMKAPPPDIPVTPLLNTLEEYDEFQPQASVAEMMYVPEEVRKEWVQADTRQFFLQDEFKRELLEEYLRSLPQDKRLKAINVMCENSNSKNYFRFLDLSTAAYTPNQEILSNDLINFFHNKYLNEYIDQQQTLQRLAPQKVDAPLKNSQAPVPGMLKNPEIYNRTMTDQNYYNPYDDRDMITPKIKNDPENDFLIGGNKQQDEMFNRMDRNSAMYVRQQSQFNNTHNDIAKIRQAQLQASQPAEPLSPVAPITASTPTPSQPTSLRHYQNGAPKSSMASHGSLITEIPQVDNIADFINSRNALAHQNNLRKQYNIASSIEYNNELVGAHDTYNLPGATQPVIASQPTMNITPTTSADAPIENSIPSVYLSPIKFEPAQQTGALHDAGLDKNMENEGVIKTAMMNNEMVHDVNSFHQDLNSYEPAFDEEKVIDTPEQLQAEIASAPVPPVAPIPTPVITPQAEPNSQPSPASVAPTLTPNTVTPSDTTPISPAPETPSTDEPQAADEVVDDTPKTIKVHNQVSDVTPLAEVMKKANPQFSPEELDQNDDNRIEQIKNSSQEQVGATSSEEEVLDDRYRAINAVGAEFISNRKEAIKKSTSLSSAQLQVYRLEDFNRIENFFKENRPYLTSNKKDIPSEGTSDAIIVPKKRKSKGRLHTASANATVPTTTAHDETPDMMNATHSIIPTKTRMEKYDVRENEEEIVIKKRVLA